MKSTMQLLIWTLNVLNWMMQNEFERWNKIIAQYIFLLLNWMNVLRIGAFICEFEWHNIRFEWHEHEFECSKMNLNDQTPVHDPNPRNWMNAVGIWLANLRTWLQKPIITTSTSKMWVST